MVPDSGNLDSGNDDDDDAKGDSERSGYSFELNSGNLWLDAMAQELEHVGMDARNISPEKKKGSDRSNSNLASLVLAADGQLESLHRQTREARARNLAISNLSPEYKHKMEATLEQVLCWPRAWSPTSDTRPSRS